MNEEAILIIHRFCVCEFTCPLKVMCNPKSILTELSWLFTDMCRAVKDLSCPMCLFQVRLSKVMLSSCFSSHIVSNCLMCGLFSATFFTSWCFLLVILLFEKNSEEVLNCCLVFLNARRLRCALPRIY